MPIKYYRLRKNLPAFKAGTECYIEEAGNMVPCRGISYVIVHKDQLEENPNILTDWFEEINESTRWKPESNHMYCFIRDDCDVYYDIWTGDIDQKRFDLGNCFQTKEEAEKAAEYLKALAVVRGDATSEFVRGNENWHVCYETRGNYLYSRCNFCDETNGIFGLPYFATEEDAQRSIEVHKKEWLTIFGVKEEDEATQ